MPDEYPDKGADATNDPPKQSDRTEGSKRVEYVVAKHVAILDEHPMEASGIESEMYCGPAELQRIADNNNRRVEMTGDATPVVIGHTEDGKEEKAQPEIVGYATNFAVGPLFNTGRMAVFADIHVKKDRVKEVNKYPRRSVELWPKRWEIDPISLLGATTPERDLGLLQFNRSTKSEEVIRYSRTLARRYTTPARYLREEPNGSKLSQIDESGLSHDENFRITDSGKNSSNSRESTGDRKMAKEELPGSGGDEGTAKIVEAVLASAPIQEMLQNQQEILSLLQGGAGGGEGQPGMGDEGMAGDMGGQPGGAPFANGAPGGGPMGGPAPGSPEHEAAWYHEGEPERYEEDETSGDDGGVTDEVHTCYGSQCDHPCHYAPHAGHTAHKMGRGEMNQMSRMGEEDMSQMARSEEAAKMARSEDMHQYGAYSSSTNSYIPREGHMGGHHGGIHPGSRRRKSQKSAYTEYLESLKAGDTQIRQSRTVREVEQLKSQVRELALDKIQYKRAEILRTLQASEGIDMDVAEEVVDTMALSDQEFTNHVEKIKKRYQRDPSTVTMVRTAAPTAPVSPTSRMSPDERIRYQRELNKKVQSIRQANPTMSPEAAVKQAIAEQKSA